MHHPKREPVLAALALFSLAAAAAVPRDSALWARALPVAAAALVCFAALVPPGPAASIGLLVLVLCAAALTGLAWQLVMLVAIAAVFVAGRLERRMGGVRVQRGRVPFWATFACAAVTPLGLLGWVWLLEPDLNHIVAAVPPASPLLLILGGVSFALLNATLEEWIWRGLLQERLAPLFGVGGAIAIQALSFGSIHAHGFPSGVVGVTLAAVWGAMLGALRQSSGGLLAPLVAHIVADATIAAIVLSRVL